MIVRCSTYNSTPLTQRHNIKLPTLTRYVEGHLQRAPLITDAVITLTAIFDTVVTASSQWHICVQDMHRMAAWGFDRSGWRQAVEDGSQGKDILGSCEGQA